MQAIGYKAAHDGESLDGDNLLQYINPKDLKDFGLIPEIIGRLTSINIYGSFRC